MAADASRHTEHADAELVERVRAGDNSAFAELYERYAQTALRYARRWTKRRGDAEDLSAEAFTRVLRALRRGGGPDATLLPYLLTTMRRVAIDWSTRDRRMIAIEDPEALMPPLVPGDPVVAALDRDLAAKAFASLPERWQSVLWHTEIEGDKPGRIAPILGIEPGAVSALAYRAREGLRQAYLQAHVTTAAEPCRPFARHLGEYVRGGLGTRNRARVEQHLAACVDCQATHAELLHLNTSIPAVIAPVVLGAVIAARLLATATHDSPAGALHTSVAHWLVLQFAKRTRAMATVSAAAALGATVAFGMVGHVGALTEIPLHPRPTATPTGRPTIPHAVAPPSPSAPHTHTHTHTHTHPDTPPPPRPAATTAPRRINRPPTPKPRPTPVRKPSPSPRPTPSPTPTRPPSPSPAPSHHPCPMLEVRVSLGIGGVFVHVTVCAPGPVPPIVNGLLNAG